MYRFNYTFPLILLRVRSPVKRNLRSENSSVEEHVKRTQVSLAKATVLVLLLKKKKMYDRNLRNCERKQMPD